MNKRNKKKNKQKHQKKSQKQIREKKIKQWNRIIVNNKYLMCNKLASVLHGSFGVADTGIPFLWAYSSKSVLPENLV